jgi:spore coat protein A, manganese oxidase
MKNLRCFATRAFLALLLTLLPGAVFPQTLLRPATQPQFVHPLPNPLDNVLLPDTKTYPGYDYYHVTMNQVRRPLGLFNPTTEMPLETTVWAYSGSFPGPTFEARRGRPVKVLFTNDLTNGKGMSLPHLLPLDTTLDCGLDSFGDPTYCRPFVRTVPYLYGARTDDLNSGNPEAWFTAGFEQTGPKWSDKSYDYPNDQEAATLWYHDRAIGITRLNVYAGLAGFYLLRDDVEKGLQTSGVLPTYPYEVPLMIQDRSFYTDGSLAYPQDPFLDEKGNPVSLDPITGRPVPSIIPELYGDFILANGVVWPYLKVEPRPYRFRILNGSDSRFYTLSVSGKYSKGISVVGGDGGFLNRVVQVRQLVLAPGERADVILDFSASAGQTLTLINTAPTPYPAGTAPDPRTTGRVLQLRVQGGVTPIPWVDLSKPFLLRPPIEWPRPTPGLPARGVLLMEGTDSIGREMPALGTWDFGLMRWADPVTETPRAGTTEVWQILNASEYSYPIHLDGVQVQVIERQNFDLAAYVPGKPQTLVYTGKPVPPLAEESGWKDTVRAAPGEVTRIAVSFDLGGEFVWRCSIQSHQDNEMMRPLFVMH